MQIHLKSCLSPLSTSDRQPDSVTYLVLRQHYTRYARASKIVSDLGIDRRNQLGTRYHDCCIAIMHSLFFKRKIFAPKLLLHPRCGLARVRKVQTAQRNITVYDKQ
jgi:hypothetical protein